MMRPSVSLPTGTEIGAPAGVADVEAATHAFGGTHRDRAHDAVAELLLHFERQVLALRPCSASYTFGTASRGNSTSITAPMICTIFPLLIFVFLFSS
jgi:hypothetical protein